MTDLSEQFRGRPWTEQMQVFAAALQVESIEGVELNHDGPLSVEGGTQGALHRGPGSTEPNAARRALKAGACDGRA